MADVIPNAEELPFTLHPVGDVIIIEFRSPSLMDALVLEKTGEKLFQLIDEQDKRKVIIDFEKVQYLSSQAIGILLTMKKKLDALRNSKLVLCGVTGRLQELLKITRLDKVLTVKPTQKEAMAVFQ